MRAMVLVGCCFAFYLVNANLFAIRVLNRAFTKSNNSGVFLIAIAHPATPLVPFFIMVFFKRVFKRYELNCMLYADA